jgi:hypothetical protein
VESNPIPSFQIESEEKESKFGGKIKPVFP